MIEPARDGGIFLRFQVGDLREVKRWVMFWGADCRIVEPEILGVQVFEECRSIIQSMQSEIEVHGKNHPAAE
jgi:hypothetical protein